MSVGYTYNGLMALTREMFMDRLTHIVREKFPLVKLTSPDGGFAVRINGHLAPLENLYRMSSLDPDQLQYHIQRWVVELLRVGEGTPDEEGSFELLKDRVLPMVLAADVAEQRTQIVWQPLIDGLIVAYAIDSDRTIAYLTKSHFKRWKIDADQLHETAMNNLVAKSQAIAAHAAQDDDSGRVNLIIFQQMDGYDASRILLPTLHERLREHLGSPFVAAIPNRDILLCLREDEDTLKRLRGQVTEDFLNMPHQISQELFLVTNDGIAPRG